MHAMKPIVHEWLRKGVDYVLLVVYTNLCTQQEVHVSRGQESYAPGCRTNTVLHCEEIPPVNS